MFISSWAKGETLLSRIESKNNLLILKPTNDTRSELTKWALQIAPQLIGGVVEYARRRIPMSDLRADNVLIKFITKTPWVRINDFDGVGFVKPSSADFVKEVREAFSQHGPETFSVSGFFAILDERTALFDLYQQIVDALPEQLSPLVEDFLGRTLKLQSWQLGILLLHLMTFSTPGGMLPFFTCSSFDRFTEIYVTEVHFPPIFERLEKLGYRTQLGEERFDALKQLFQELLHMDKEKRISPMEAEARIVKISE